MSYMIWGYVAVYLEVFNTYRFKQHIMSLIRLTQTNQDLLHGSISLNNRQEQGYQLYIYLMFIIIDYGRGVIATLNSLKTNNYVLQTIAIDSTHLITPLHVSLYPTLRWRGVGRRIRRLHARRLQAATKPITSENTHTEASERPPIGWKNSMAS